MIEVVFSDSAAGSLKQAQHNLQGSFSPGLGGFSDVFCLDLAFSIGDLQEEGISKKRLEVLNLLFKCYPEAVGRPAAEKLFQTGVQNFKIIQERFFSREAIRLWYSDQPDELCGFYWFLAQLDGWNLFSKVCAVKIPTEGSNGQKNSYPIGCGALSPEEWQKYLPLQKDLSREFIAGIALRWRNLQQENAPLRVVINGTPQSVPEDFYDSLIKFELEKQNDPFWEAQIIGQILGNAKLGISDGWLASRMEKMIESGCLIVLSPAPPSRPKYRRILKKKDDLSF